MCMIVKRGVRVCVMVVSMRGYLRCKFKHVLEIIYIMLWKLKIYTQCKIM